MKLTTYNNILESFHVAGTGPFIMRDIIDKYPQYSEKTLGSILSQECQRKMKKTHCRHYQPEKMDEYYFRYCEESQRDCHALLHMAQQVDLAPAMMARLVLERYLAYSQYNGNAPPKSVTTQFLRNTSLIDDVRLAMHIDVCLAADDVYGPVVDIIKHSVGHEYEFLLKRKLDEANLAFFDETQLRARGYDKTPDFILQVPVAVGGRVINWIESKASFGDQESHANYLREQFWSYWNRFGSGLVIYWFGFIDELDVHSEKGIALIDHFPENIVTMAASS